MRIGINGLGRIGKCVLRAFFEYRYNEFFELVALNNSSTVEANVHAVKYDSTHGKFCFPVSHIGGNLEVAGSKVALFNKRNPEEIPWKEAGVDLVMECTGSFKDREGSMLHIKAGAKKVIISSPAKNEDKTVIFGVNHSELQKTDNIIAAGSCTTNCIVPLIKVLYESVGIKYGFATTVHSYTNDQRVLDGSHKDLYRSRACALSMIPSSSGAQKLIPKIFPELYGNIDIASLRVPTPNVSMVDFTFCPQDLNVTSEATINKAFEHASQGNLQGVMSYCDEPMVSTDFTHDKHSAVFDAKQTIIVNKNMVRIAAWYDNEWAFATRMLDIAKYIYNNEH